MMDLYIETLTGAAFELRVSPFETIQSVKAKIYRLEGIPICQQHLIWQTVELEDDYCLHDYEIHNGATLKLVLAMRGGPINTRRVPIEESPLVEYMESTPDDLLDKLPGSSRQVTLLVFREGDQLNFFRVVDRGDGTLTPLSESLSAASMYNMYDEEEEGETGSKEKLEENARIKEKISSLRTKMDNLSVTKKVKSAAPLSSTVPSASSGRLQALHSAHSKPQSALNRNRCLPPVSSHKSTTAEVPTSPHSATEHNYASTKLEPAVTAPPLSTLTAQPALNASTLTELTIPKPPTEPRTPNHGISQRLHHHQSGLLISPPTAAVTTSGDETAGADWLTKARSLCHTDSEKSLGGLNKSESVVRSIPEHELISSRHNQASASAGRSGPAAYSKRKEVLSLDKIKETLRAPTGTACEAGAAASTAGDTGTPLYTRRASSRQHEIRAASRQHADLTLETIKDSFYSQRIKLESLSSNEAKMMSGLLQQASLEKLGSSSISNFSPPIRSRKSSVPNYSNYHTIDNITGADRISTAGSRPIPDALEILGPSSAKLPPVKSKKKGKASKRCFVCAKKTGLATSYICRCGNNFCAAHRYAELHDCTYDYKTEGRQLLEQNNPVVSAPKLPKI